MSSSAGSSVPHVRASWGCSVSCGMMGGDGTGGGAGFGSLSGVWGLLAPRDMVLSPNIALPSVVGLGAGDGDSPVEREGAGDDVTASVT